MNYSVLPHLATSCGILIGFFVGHFILKDPLLWLFLTMLPSLSMVFYEWNKNEK